MELTKTWEQALWLEGAECQSDGFHETSTAIANALKFGIETEREARLVLATLGYSSGRIDKVLTAFAELTATKKE